MKTLCTAVLGLALTAGVATLAPDDDPPAGDGRSYEPVASLDALMTGHGMAFGSIRAAIPDKDNKRRARTIQLGAELLGELANINVNWGRRDDYRDWAGELRDTALELAVEAKKRDEMDEGAIRAAYEKLDATCSSCHEVYK